MRIDTFIPGPTMFDLGRQVEPGLRTHLRHVYSALTITTFVAAFGVFIGKLDICGSADVLVKVLGTIFAVGFIAVIASTDPDVPNGDFKRFWYLHGMSFCLGLVLGPSIKTALGVNPLIVMTALIYTCVIFSCFTVSTIIGYEIGYVYLGAPLMAVCSALLLTSILNTYINYFPLKYYEVMFAVLMDAGFILYDTSRIMEKYRNRDRDYVLHALVMFIDVFYLFKDIIAWLVFKEDSRSSGNNNNSNNSSAPSNNNRP